MQSFPVYLSLERSRDFFEGHKKKECQQKLAPKKKLSTYLRVIAVEYMKKILRKH